MRYSVRANPSADSSLFKEHVHGKEATYAVECGGSGSSGDDVAGPVVGVDGRASVPGRLRRDGRGDFASRARFRYAPSVDALMGISCPVSHLAMSVTVYPRSIIAMSSSDTCATTSRIESPVVFCLNGAPLACCRILSTFWMSYVRAMGHLLLFFVRYCRVMELASFGKLQQCVDTRWRR